MQLLNAQIVASVSGQCVKERHIAASVPLAERVHGIACHPIRSESINELTRAQPGEGVFVLKAAKQILRPVAYLQPRPVTLGNRRHRRVIEPKVDDIAALLCHRPLRHCPGLASPFGDIAEEEPVRIAVVGEIERTGAVFEHSLRDAYRRKLRLHEVEHPLVANPELLAQNVEASGQK